jgi:acetyltransferase-like isoleucine patch superfamily enzyme
MNNFEVPGGETIPYYDEKDDSFFSNIKIVASKRNKGILAYLIYKFRISILQTLAKSCPVNSLRILFHRWRGVHIGRNAYIGRNVYIDNYYPNFIYLGDNIVLNAECMIIAHFNPPKRFRYLFEAKADPVIINSGAMIGIRAVIMPGITIGECAVVTAGSIVMKNVAPFTMVQGNPIKRILDFKHLMK